MLSELRNQTFVAASAAEQQGFENTYLALVDILREMDRGKIAPSSTKELSEVVAEFRTSG